MNETVEKGTHFQFFPKGDGFVIYNPYSQKFVGHREGIFAGCHHYEFAKAEVFTGLKVPMDDRYWLRAAPSLFRTKMTADGEGLNVGFQRSAASKWFAFLDVHNEGRWLKADKNHDVVSFKNSVPMAWEKFEVAM